MKLKFIFPDLGHFPLVYRRYIPVLGPAILAALTPPEVEISFSDERLSAVDIEEACDLVAISVMTPQAGGLTSFPAFIERRASPWSWEECMFPCSPKRPNVTGRLLSSARPKTSGRSCWKTLAGEGFNRSTAAELRHNRFLCPGGISFLAIPISP